MRRLTVIPTAVPLEEADWVADPAPPVVDQVVRSLEAQRIRRCVRGLPRFEGKVLTLRYGLDGAEPASIRECAEFLHCSPSLVHKTERRALEALQDQLVPEDDFGASAALRPLAVRRFG